jgi:CO/xanthine dehydrogenase FAD-binding subunit
MDVMSVRVPRSLDELVAALAAEPGSELLAGGTDLMVEVNFGRRRPESVLSVTRVPELQGWHTEEGTGDLVLGAALTYTEMLEPPLAGLLPALAQAARTVGSPQIRNAGTVGGNLATASPAGDTLPVLLALGASVVTEAADGRRELPLAQFVLGPKQSALRPEEVIGSVRVPAAAAAARQEFVKVGTRNAMVIAVCSAAVVLDPAARSVRVGLGSVGPVPLGAPEAEALAEAGLDWERGGTLPPGSVAAERLCSEFAELVSAAARPIDDHRSSAAYRRHAVGVCAARALGRLAGAVAPPEQVAS